jgi:hypothetical protein
MAKKKFIFSIFCGLIFAAVLLTGCSKDGENQELPVNKNIVLGPHESVTYNIRYSGYSAADFALTSDRPVNIDSDWADLDNKGIITFNKRIFYSGSPTRPGGFSVPLPGDKFKVVNPDPYNKANVHISLTGVKIY